MRSLPIGLLALAACTGGAVGQRGQAIVDGEPSTGDPAVVGITSAGLLHCTGTLISKRHVVTAAHCVPPYLDFVDSPDDLEIFFGNDIDGEGEFVPVVAVDTGPWNPEDYPGDIAMLAMERQVGVAPIPMATTWQPQFGEEIRIVGFGLEVETTIPGRGGDGIKREGISTVDGPYSSGIDLVPGPSVICSGDSGGPGLAMEGNREVLAMVHSRGDCESTSYHESITNWRASFIEPFMSTHPEGTCAEDDVCADGCEEPDPDCECVADGFCTNCERGWWWDPDCPAECGDDGVCLPEGCAVPDPDCGSCGNDGECNTQCEDDPDCGPCAGDGSCNSECSVDPDCGAGANGGGGCRAVGSDAPFWLFACIGLVLALSRRRRGGQ